MLNWLEMVHKKRLQSGGRGSSADKGGGRVLQMRTPAIFGAKTRIFWNLLCVCTATGKGGVKPVRTFCG